MRKERQTRAQLDAEIQALVARKEKMADAAVELFVKNLVSKEVRNLLADSSDEIVKSAAKLIQRSFQNYMMKAERELENRNLQQDSSGS